MSSRLTVLHVLAYEVFFAEEGSWIAWFLVRCDFYIYVYLDAGASVSG